MSTPLPEKRKLYRRNPSHVCFFKGLQIHDEPIPPMTDTSILIKVHAVALNYRDANMINQTNPWETLATGIPCSDAAGEVVAIGGRVTRFKMGDRVCPIVEPSEITGKEWLGGDVDGVLAEYVVTEEGKLVKAPDSLSYAEAATLPVAAVTAWSGLKNLPAGGTVLIQGTGGVSMFGAKFAKAMGNKVFLSSSSDEKLARVRKISGLETIESINYVKQPKWEEEVVRKNGGVGVDLVLENGGSSSLMQSIKATKIRGTISQIGYLGKQDGKHLDGLVSGLIEKAITLRGINVGSRADFEDMNRLIGANAMRFEEVIDRKLGFDQVPKAFEYLWSGGHVGKIVIEI